MADGQSDEHGSLVAARGDDNLAGGADLGTAELLLPGPSLVTATSLAAVASVAPSGRRSTTTGDSVAVPGSVNVAAAASVFRPVSDDNDLAVHFDLQRAVRQFVRVRSVSTYSVVATRMMRNITRIGAITTVLTSRAAVVTGTMSPYPMAGSVTVAYWTLPGTDSVLTLPRTDSVLPGWRRPSTVMAQVDDRGGEGQQTHAPPYPSRCCRRGRPER